MLIFEEGEKKKKHYTISFSQIKVESGKVKSSDIGTTSQNFTVYRRSLSPIRPPPHNRYLQQMSGGQIVNTQIKEETESDEEPKEMSPAPAVSKVRLFYISICVTEVHHQLLKHID